MTTQINAEKNITVDDVNKKIEQFDFRRWVWAVFSDERDINGISNGSEIYERVFEPVLFDTKSKARHEFLEYIGYFNLMKTLRSQEMTSDERAEISRDILKRIRDSLKSLYVGNFEYPTPVSQHWIAHIISDDRVLKWRKHLRSQFKKALKENNLTIEEAFKIIQENTGEKNVALAKEISLKHIATAAENRKKRLHQRRTDVSRVIMRADLPSDLVPLVCAYAVPESKTYDYM